MADRQGAFAGTAPTRKRLKLNCKGKLRDGQPSNSRLVLYFDVVTRRPPYSAFSSARQPALAPWPRRHEHAHPVTPDSDSPESVRSCCGEDPDEQVMHVALAPAQASPPLQLRSSSRQDSDEQVMHIALAPPQASPPLQLRSRCRS
jgi:hypothetical protein